jgi:hypothetical protein
VSPADPRPELGPRSLDPDRRFCGAFAELIRDQFVAYRLLQLRYDVRATKPGLPWDPRRDGDLDLLPVLTCHALSLAGAVTRGEPRYVRWRRPQCWFFPLARVCPTVMPPSPPHLRSLRLRSIVRIDVHGSKDRAKDASPGACDDVSCLRRVHAHRSRMPTAFPSSASFGHPLSSARLASREDARETSRTDQGPRSDDAPRRAPPSRRPGCLSPSRHVEEVVPREGIAPSGLHAGSLAHAAHTFPPVTRAVFLIGHCKVTVRSPADP